MSHSWRSLLIPTVTCGEAYVYQESKAVKCAMRLDSVFNRTPCIPWSVTRGTRSIAIPCSGLFLLGEDKKNQLDVTFCILYFSSNSCSTCFGQPCDHHQELTTAWCYSLVLLCSVAAGRLSRPVGRECVHGRTTWKRNKEYKKWHLVGFSYPHRHSNRGHPKSHNRPS